MYSYGWRDYMPDIGRWNGIDQLAENYLSTSTYAYVANNPVSYADVDGRWFDQDGHIVNTSGQTFGFLDSSVKPKYATNFLGLNPGDGGGSGGSAQALIARASGLGGSWTNTGYGFQNDSNIALGYDGSYTSLNTELDGYINIPEVVISGSSWGMQAQGYFNSFMSSFNAKSDFAWDRMVNAGRYNDGPIQYVGGAGDPFGAWEVGGMALSGMSGGKANYILAALMITRSGNTGSTLKLLNAEKGIISGNSQKMLASYYPLDGGAMGKWSNTTLKIGSKIDRFGSNYGKYFSNVGTPMEMRALPPGNTGAYTAFEVLKPFTVQTSKIAPAFGNIGTGVQYYSPFLNANELIMGGFIKPIP